jgi:hypothetical protein
MIETYTYMLGNDPHKSVLIGTLRKANTLERLQMTIKTSSAKAKGRNTQNEVIKLLRKYYPTLSEDDLRGASGGQTGEDILMSPLAKGLIKLDIEVKRRKKIAVLEFLEQAQKHGKHIPVVFMREDRGKMCVLIDANDFLDLITKETTDEIPKTTS